jgi:hypothetical protein
LSSFLAIGNSTSTHYKLESRGKQVRFVDALEVYGEELFGRRIRLRVLLWAHQQKQAFNQSEASKGVDYSSSGEVAKELERLVRLGMLRKFGRPSRVGPQNYVRVEHPGWAIAGAARTAVHAGLKNAKDDRHKNDNRGENDEEPDEPRPRRVVRRPDAPVRLHDVRRGDPV